MGHQATWHSSDNGMGRAFVYAVLIHIVVIVFVGLSFRWTSSNQSAGESVIKAKAVTLPAKPAIKPEPKVKPKPVKKAKPKAKPRGG